MVMDKKDIIAYRLSSKECAREYNDIHVWLMKKFTKEHLIFLQNDLLIWGKKEHLIDLQSIKSITIKFSSDSNFSPNGEIIVQVNSGKKYKQKYIKDIYNVLIRILQRYDYLGIVYPKIRYWGLLGNGKQDIDLNKLWQFIHDTKECPQEPLSLYSQTTTD